MCGNQRPVSAGPVSRPQLLSDLHTSHTSAYNMTWILLSLAFSLAVACRKDVMLQVKQCMSPLQMYSIDQAEIFLLMSNLDKTSQLCSEGKIQNAFACLNQLYNKCAKSKEGTKHFDLIVDVGKWRQAMENICNNIHYLQDHEECEAQAYQEYKPCADQELALFSRQMSNTWAEMASPSSVSEDQKTEAVMDVGCSFTIKILDCLRKPFTKYCPRPLTNLMVNTFEDFMLPACVKRTLINSIDRIPKYKHINQDKTNSDNNNNNNNNNNNSNSSVATEVFITGSTLGTVDNHNNLDNKDDQKPTMIHVVEPAVGAGGRKEAVGSARWPDELDSLSLRLSASRCLTMTLVLACRCLLGN